VATTLQNRTTMVRTLFITGAALTVLAAGCGGKAPSGGNQPKPNTGMRTIDSSNVRLAPIDPPPMLTDEAPPVKTVTGLAQADAPPPPTPQDEALRASLPFSPAIAMDPVDGSKISIRASIPTVEYKNKLYYFANEDHKRTFVANPEQYTKGLFSHL
jgi:YHS domain-containing protein